MHCQDHNKELHLDGQLDFMAVLGMIHRCLQIHKHHNEGKYPS